MKQRITFGSYLFLSVIALGLAGCDGKSRDAPEVGLVAEAQGERVGAEQASLASKASSEPMIVLAERPGLPKSLEIHARRQVIVVGTVTGIRRTAHSPYISDGPHQHTVFSFKVERLLKDELGISSSQIKVRQEMGDLPWRDGSRSGTGFRYSDEPLLVKGKRYLLFLRRPELPVGMTGHVASYNGVSGKSGDRDELTFQSGAFDQVLIHDGRLQRPAVPPSHKVEPWRYSEGPQLLGLSEEEGTLLVSQSVKRLRQRTAAFKEQAAREHERQLKVAGPPKRSTPPFPGRDDSRRR